MILARCAAAVLVFATTAGCVSLPSATTQDHSQSRTGSSPVRIERGRPNRAIDGVGWVVGLPSKLALWDRRADNHNISSATESDLIEYMLENDLGDVLVRVNQYDPIGEWQRLTRNDRVGAGWRYTFGTLNMLEYTLLPGRILGGDWYNPFTDTINLYSDIPALALMEASYAKDVRHRRLPGGYAAVNELPIVGMWHETVASRDVLDYIKTRGTEAEQLEAYQIIYPDYGASWGGQVASFIPFGHLFGRLAGAAVGHTANGIRTLTTSHNNRASTEPASKNRIHQVPIDAVQQDPQTRVGSEQLRNSEKRVDY